MPDLNWGNDLTAALKSAGEENKLIFIAFSNPDCRTCRRMDEDTLSRETVTEYFDSRFVLLKFSSSRNPEKYLRMKVTETPTYIVINASGSELLRLTGYVSEEDLISRLQSTGA